MRYEQSDRGPLMIAALVCFAAFIAFGILEDAPRVVLIPPAIGLALIVAAILRGARHGTEVSPGRLTIWSGDQRDTYSASDIAALIVIDWSDSTYWRLESPDGAQRELPDQALPPRATLRAMAQQLAVPLREE